MNNSQIHAILQYEVPRLNRTISDVNRGGCGFVAVALHRALAAVGVPSDIVLLNAGYNDSHVQRLIEFTNTTNINDAYHYLFDYHMSDGRISRDTLNGHVGVKVNGLMYDGEGRTRYKAISEHITVPTMQRFLTVDSVWNSTFRNANRHLNVPVWLKEFFTDVFQTEQ